MKTLQHWEETLLSSLTAFSHRIFNVLPNVLGALLILLVGLVDRQGSSSGYSEGAALSDHASVDDPAQ